MAKVTSFFTEIFTRRSSSSTNFPDIVQSSPEERIILLKEVSVHDHAKDCWIIIYDRVYDVTDFLDEVIIILIDKLLK